jgi:hypothetical protein
MKGKLLAMLGFVIALTFANTASAAVLLDVTPEDGITVAQGGTITYIVNVTGEADLFFSQDEDFSIEETDKQPGWTYTFDPETVTVTAPFQSEYSTLTIVVASDAPLGVYQHTVIAEGYDEFGRLFDIVVELDTEVINTEVIPEFTTIAIPVAAIFGLLLLIRRRKQK